MDITVFRNGTVFTADAAGSLASAVAVESGRIAAVGGDRDVAEWRGRGADVVDLRGRMLVPGFVDAHVHPVMGGLERNRCDLTSGETLEEYRRTIASYVAATPDAPWVLGGGWGMPAFPHGRAHRDQLDDVVGRRPVYLPNRDHHSAWVSTATLELAGITAETPDPPGGRIERDVDGSPTGMLHEGAMDLVERVVPPDTQADHDAGLRTALAYLHSVGVVGWQDAWVSSHLDAPSVHQAYVNADQEGWLTARVAGALWWERDTATEDVEAEVARLAAIRDRTNAAGRRYGIHSVKVMQDGVAETFTASMLEPYLDRCGCATDNTGIAFLEPELLRQVVTALDATGFQVHAHVLGDRAVRDMLDALTAAREANRTADRRHHLAHLQFVDAADRGRLARLQVAANMQALWALHDDAVDDLTIPFVGPDRGEEMYPFGDLFRAGTTLAMGSDWPVSSADPLQAIHVAVNRTGPGGTVDAGPLGERQALDLVTALRAYTAGSAFVNWSERHHGTIRVGAAADLAVLSQDLFAIPAKDICSAVVDSTFVDGVEVYARA
jgi:predicted amidohydrolase YtcJ